MALTSPNIKWHLLAILFFSYAIVNAQTPGSYNAIALGGKSAHGSIADDSTLNPTNALTIEAWIKADSFKTGGITNHIVSKHGNGAGYDLRLNVNGGLNFRIGTRTGWKFIHSNRKLNKGEWYHVAGTFNGDSLSLYINGSHDKSKDVVASIGVSTGLAVKIGEYSRPLINTLPGGNFDGMIDEIRIWGEALDSIQIKEWMCKKIQKHHPVRKSLLAYYRFDENTGSSITDLSGNGNNGSLFSTNRIRSGAPLGDTSIFSAKGYFKYATQNGDSIVIRTDSAVNKGVYFYHVNEASADTNLVNSNYQPGLHYFGFYSLDSGGFIYRCRINYNSKDSFYNNRSCYLDILFKDRRADLEWKRDTLKRFIINDSFSIKNTKAQEVQLAKFFNRRKLIIKRNDTIRCENEFVRLTAFGNDSFKYQWYFNGNALVGDTANFIRVNKTGVYHANIARNTSCNYKSIPVNVKIMPIPKVSLPRQKAICEYADTAVINGGLPKGGFYSGFIVVKDSLVLPKQFNSGLYPIFYTYTDSNGCTNTDTQLYRIQEKPEAKIRRNPDLCNNEDTFNLNQITIPTGGISVGKGIYGSTFFLDSVSATSSDYSFTYFYTDSIGCKDTANGKIFVNESTKLKIKSINDTCINTGEIKLKANAKGANIYGKGVFNNAINTKQLGVGTHNVFATYTNIYNCVSNDTLEFTIRSLDSVSFSGINQICQNDTMAILKSAKPVGGTYLGAGITGNQLIRNMVDTNSRIDFSYVYTNAFGCSDTAQSFIEVADTQDLKIISANEFYCTADTIIELAQVEPKGGFYLIKDSFVQEMNPNKLRLGKHVVNYRFNNSKNCISNAKVAFVIKQTPVAQFMIDSTVNQGDSVEFSNLSYPLDSVTSTWRIAGKQTFLFKEPNPKAVFDSLGKHDITLIVENREGACKDSISGIIKVVLNTTSSSHLRQKINLYPNPTKDVITIKHRFNGELAYKLLTLDGREVESGSILKTDTLNLNNLESGTYFMLLLPPNGEETPEVLSIIKK